MNVRILLYSLLALLWAGLALAIFFGAHEVLPWFARAEDWKRYLAMGICGLMFLMNVARITMIRQAQRLKAETHDSRA
jgi:hypothetical protein